MKLSVRSVFQDRRGKGESDRRKSGHEGWVKHDPEDKKTRKTKTFHAVSIPVFFRNASQYKKYTPLECGRVALKQNYTSYGQ